MRRHAGDVGGGAGRSQCLVEGRVVRWTPGRGLDEPPARERGGVVLTVAERGDRLDVPDLGDAPFERRQDSVGQLQGALAVVLRGADGAAVVAATVGTDFVPRIVSALPDGWPAIERSLPQSAEELAATLPGSVALMRAGHALQPVLTPVTHRSRPLPAWVRKAFIVATLALVARHLTGRITRGAREGTP